MSLDKATVAKIARLARLKVDDAHLEPMVRELNNILAFVEQLNEVKTDGVPPLTSVVETRLKMRDDVITDGGHPEKILANAPAAESGFFTVPKVVE